MATWKQWDKVVSTLFQRRTPPLYQRCVTLKIRPRILFHFQCRINVISTFINNANFFGRWESDPNRQSRLFFTTLAFERNCVPYVLTCQRVLRTYVHTCQRGLHAYVLTCQCVLRAYVLTCQCVLCAHVPMFLMCLRANLPCVPTCLCALTSNNKNKFSMACFP